MSPFVRIGYGAGSGALRKVGYVAYDWIHCVGSNILSRIDYIA